MTKHKLIKPMFIISTLFLTACGTEKPSAEVVKNNLENAIKESSMGLVNTTFENIEILDCEELENTLENIELAVECRISADTSTATFLSGDKKEQGKFDEKLSFIKTNDKQWLVYDSY